MSLFSPSRLTSHLTPVTTALALIALGSLFVSACAFVPQSEREFLSDPIMMRSSDGVEAALEGHDFPRREGSVGGSSGSGGGCGC